MKNVELKWTDSNEAHIARHGVAPIEVEQVLSSEPLVWVNGREGTKLVYGQSYSGRLLLVVLADSEDGRNFVVTSRDMTVKEARTFKARR